MLFYEYLLTLACLSFASGRTFKPRLPGGLSHSIVNFGKMDFNVYLNSKSESPKGDYGIAPPKPRFLQSEVVGCPCQMNSKTQEEEATDFIVDLITGNGPSRFKETKNSVLCCTSEETQEELILEFKPHGQPFPPMRHGFQPIPQRIPPKLPQFSAIKFPPMPSMPLSQNVPPLTIFPLDDLFPKNMQLTGASPFFLDNLFRDKIKMPEFKKIDKIEIFVEPTRKTRWTTTAPTTTTAAIKSEIKPVGEKKTTMLYDLMATNLSVKKDLTQDIGGRYKDVETIRIPRPTGSFNQNNTL